MVSLLSPGGQVQPLMCCGGWWVGREGGEGDQKSRRLRVTEGTFFWMAVYLFRRLWLQGLLSVCPVLRLLDHTWLGLHLLTTDTRFIAVGIQFLAPPPLTKMFQCNYELCVSPTPFRLLYPFTTTPFERYFRHTQIYKICKSSLLFQQLSSQVP